MASHRGFGSDQEVEGIIAPTGTNQSGSSARNGINEHAVTHKDTGAMEGIKLLEHTLHSHPVHLSDLHV